MNLTFLDVFILIILVASLIVGYIRGFTKRVLSVIGTLIAFFMAWSLSKPISSLLSFNINSLNILPSDILNTVYPIVYQFIAFLGLLLIFTIIKVIVLIILKPVVKKVIDSFVITGILDGILGAVLNFIKCIVSFYIIFLMACLPINLKATAVVNDSIIAQKILNLLPNVTSSVQSISKITTMVQNFNSNNFFENVFDEKSLQNIDAKTLESVANITKSAIDLGIINEQQIQQYSQEAVEELIDLNTTITITQSQNEQLNKILQLPGISEELKTLINEKITVK